jgi:hypothetical protein
VPYVLSVLCKCILANECAGVGCVEVIGRQLRSRSTEEFVRRDSVQLEHQLHQPKGDGRIWVQCYFFLFLGFSY